MNFKSNHVLYNNTMTNIATALDTRLEALRPPRAKKSDYVVTAQGEGAAKNDLTTDGSFVIIVTRQDKQIFTVTRLMDFTLWLSPDLDDNKQLQTAVMESFRNMEIYPV